MISINSKSAATLAFVAACAFVGIIGRRSNQSHVRGTDLQRMEANRKLAEELGITFQTGNIVGGDTADTANVKWFTHFGSGICGGSLISPNRVLTAAHCVQGGAPSTVRVGATTQSNGEEISVNCANTHPDYDGFVGNDLAILKLDSSSSVTPVVLNSDSSIPAASQVLTVVGLGRTSTGGSVSSTLLQVEQTYVDPSTCDAAYGGGVVNGDQVLCALATDKGACNGDSGGPLFDSSFTQVGIVSFGSSQGCAENIPDGYTRVSNYNAWIEEQINNDDCDGCSIWDIFCLGLVRARDAVVSYSLGIFRGEAV